MLLGIVLGGMLAGRLSECPGVGLPPSTDGGSLSGALMNSAISFKSRSRLVILGGGIGDIEIAGEVVDPRDRGATVLLIYRPK